MEINYTDVFREVDAISKGLRKSIKHMPRYNRYNEGDRITCLLLDLKVSARLACKDESFKPDSKELYRMLVTLETLIDECLEDGSLLLKGEYTIHEPRMRLMDLLGKFQ